MYFIFIFWFIFFPTDSKDIVNSSIQNYVLKLFKKRKNKESNVNQTKKPVGKPIENNSNSIVKVCENITSSSLSGNNN